MVTAVNALPPAASDQIESSLAAAVTASDPVETDETPLPADPVRRPWYRRAALPLSLLLLVATLCGAGVLLYVNERNVRQQERSVGAPADGTARLQLVVSAQRVDTASQQLVLTVLPVPQGNLAAPGPEPVYSADVQLQTSSLSRVNLRLARGDTPVLQQIEVPLDDGTVTDYPFDRYDARVAWTATTAGEPLPVTMAFKDTDPFFVIKPRSESVNSSGVVLDTSISRSQGTFILAWFMMAAMWALALAVANAARVLVRKHEGLLFPALSWMAATLFALVGLRNAAPNGPPIGSLLDYAAFFWAEAIIAGSVVCVAITGIHKERRALAETS
jgi:hypothetical protein